MKKIYLIATIVAIVTGLVVFIFINGLTKANMKKSEDLNVAVVASTEIAENITVTADMVEAIYLPKEAINPSTFTDVSEVIGKVAQCKIAAGEQIMDHKVIKTGDTANSELVGRIRNGYRAITIKVDEITGMAGYLKVGDKVDLLASRSKNGVSSTYMCLQNVNIIAVGNVEGFGAESKGYNNITIEVPAKESILLYHESINGFLSMVLRGVGDESVLEIPAKID